MKRLSILLATFMALLLPVLSFVHVSAVDVIDPICQNLPASGADKPQVCKENENVKKSGDDPIFGPNGLLATVVNILSIIGAFVAVIVILIGGVKMIVSSGDANTIASSRRTVLYAVVSLAIIGSAQLIVRVLISKL